MDNLEQMIIYFPRAMKFYSFNNTLEDNVIIGKVFDLLRDDEHAQTKMVGIYEYFRLRDYYDRMNPPVKNIKETK